MSNPLSGASAVLNFASSRKSNNKAAGAQTRGIQQAIDLQQSSTDEARDITQSATDRILELYENLTPEVRDLLTQATSQAIDGQLSATDRSLGLFDDATGLAVNTLQGQNQQIQNLFDPYSSAGSRAASAQADIAGINGPEAQAAAISAIESNPAFQAQVRQGENAILQNASATGGIRGGNVQRSLSQYRPQVLNDFINNQYSRLGGIANTGFNAAANQANAAGQLGTSLANIYGSNAANQANILGGSANNIGNLLTGNASSIGNLLTGTTGNISNALSSNAANQSNLLNNNARAIADFYIQRGNVEANRQRNRSNIFSGGIDQINTLFGATQGLGVGGSPAPFYDYDAGGPF